MKVHNIFISGDIVPFTFWGENEYSIANLTADLKALVVSEGDELIADINTYGGDTETGFAMYNQLLRFKNENKISLTTRVTGYCASIGTVILLAGDKRIGNQYNNPFVHNAWTMAVGDANEMKKVYEDLQKTNDKITSIYVERTNIDFETAKALMNANDFLDPSRVLEYGFYTEIENQKILNSINYKNNNNMDFKEQLKQIYNKMFHTQNKMVYSADNVEIDFYELADGEEPVVGSKAKISDQPAVGEYVMPSGETYVFVDGALSEIKPKEDATDNVEALKAENENLKAEIESLKNSVQNQKSEIEKHIAFKNEVFNLKIETPANAIPLIAKPTNKKEVITYNFK